jgi:hypothetical protein
MGLEIGEYVAKSVMQPANIAASHSTMIAEA